jgi:hypothetical protein
MQFTQIIAAAILAYTAVAMPAPSSAAAPAPTPAAGELSTTQKLFISDTAAQRFDILSDADFKFNFDDPAKKGKGGKSGDVVPANRKTFPALVGTGAGMAVGFLDGCAFNTPHIHPRSVELQIVTKGKLVVEMAPENGVLNAEGKRRIIKNTLGVNEMTPFYQGSVHAQYNPDCTPAEFVAAFNNEDFGTGQIADELFALDGDVVSAAFGQAIDGSRVEEFKGKIPVSIANGVAECLRTCKGKIIKADGSKA